MKMQSKANGGFGHGMLLKMGWKEGSGLGREQQGRKEAIKIEKLIESAGLGSTQPTQRSIERSQMRDDRSRRSGSAKNHVETTIGESWWDASFKNALSKVKTKSDDDDASSTSSSSSSDSESSRDRIEKKKRAVETSKKRKRSDSTSSSSSSSDSDEDSVEYREKDVHAMISLNRDLTSYSEEDRELFIRCGGRRCGKRAGMPQIGKMKREQSSDEAFLKKWGAKSSNVLADIDSHKIESGKFISTMRESIVTLTTAATTKENGDGPDRDEKKKKRKKEKREAEN